MPENQQHLGLLQQVFTGRNNYCPAQRCGFVPPSCLVTVSAVATSTLAHSLISLSVKAFPMCSDATMACRWWWSNTGAEMTLMSVRVRRRRPSVGLSSRRYTRSPMSETSSPSSARSSSGRFARHARHQRVEPTPARRQPLDQVSVGAAFGDHPVRAARCRCAAGSSAPWPASRVAPRRPTARTSARPAARTGSSGRPRRRRRAPGGPTSSSSVMRSSITADSAAVVPNRADSRRSSSRAAGLTRIDSWAVWPSEISAGPSR